MGAEKLYDVQIAPTTDDYDYSKNTTVKALSLSDVVKLIEICIKDKTPNCVSVELSRSKSIDR